MLKDWETSDPSPSGLSDPDAEPTAGSAAPLPQCVGGPLESYKNGGPVEIIRGLNVTATGGACPRPLFCLL